MIDKEPAKRSTITAPLEVKEKFILLAEKHGYVYGGKGSAGGLIEAIANNELILVPRKYFEMGLDK